jgi:hypothetical protein
MNEQTFMKMYKLVFFFVCARVCVCVCESVCVCVCVSERGRERVSECNSYH